jgi:hypothetical protein
VSATKRKSAPIVPPWLRQLAWLMFGPGRTVTMAVVVVAAFSGGAWAVWRRVEKHVENSPDYLVRVEQIVVTPPPDWVRSDVRAEAFRTASPPDRPLSSLDEGLTQRVYSAFMLHPWVAKAVVTKRAPARVKVEIVYRRPVCMVEVTNGAAVELLPVDGEGVWLPGEDFSQKQKESYPCLAGVDRRPIQPVGHPWGDARVVDGAAIAAALLPVWQPLKLYRIQATSAAIPAAREHGTTFELYTRAGTRIVWGVGAAASGGEPSAKDKVARLNQYAAVHSGLDGGPPLDVRRMPPAGAEKR